MTIVLLTVVAIPFVARVMEGVFPKTDEGLVEAVWATRSTNGQTLTRIILPEGLSSIINSITMTTINVISYSATTRVLGAGGLEETATHYGHYWNELDIFRVSAIYVAPIIQVVQWIRNRPTIITSKE